MTILETPRLTLRKMNSEDAPFMLELLNDPAFIKNIGDRKVRNVEDARKYLEERVVLSYEKNGFGLYVVELKGLPKPIGISGLVRRPALEHADVGFAFLPPFCQKGYATESARAVLAYARDQLGLTQVLGITSPKNLASIKVLEKIGLSFVSLTEVTLGEPAVNLYSIAF